MSIARSLPAQSELLAMFRYETKTGILYRKDDPSREAKWRMRWAGKPCGYVSERGYIQVGIGNRNVYAHRIIWKMIYGEDPSVIDHIDGDTHNNQISNLRAANQQMNLLNSRRKAGKVLPKGVFTTPTGRFKAVISSQGVRFHLGVFETPDQAHQAYIAAGRWMHGSFFRAD